MTAFPAKVASPRGANVSHEVFNAYGALQLHPRAPHDLIERAYWALAADIKQQMAASRPGVVSLLRELNDAYSLLIDPPRRREYDSRMGFAAARAKPVVRPVRRGLFGRTATATRAPKITHYEMLAVAHDAVPAIIEAAHEYRLQQLRPNTRAALGELQLVEEAYETLRHANSRMAYDAHLEGRIRPRPPAPINGRQQAAPATRPEADAPTPRAAAASVLAEPAMEDGPGVAAEAPPPPPRRWRLPTIGRIGAGAPDAEKQALLDKERERLLELGLIDGTPKEIVHLDRELGAGPVRARFAFIAGPQAGESIELHDGSLILGSSDHADVVLRNPEGTIGAGHVRVWHRDGEYILHQLDTFSTTFVNGDRLDLRLVILEPGDEVRIGPHMIVFEQVAPAAAAASTDAVPRE